MKRFNSDIKRLKILSAKVNVEQGEEIVEDAKEDIFFYAGISSKEKLNIKKRMLLNSILIFCISIFLFKIYMAFVLPLLYVAFEYIAISSRIKKRVKNFEKDYPAFLISLASSVKSGKDPLQALISIRELFLDGSVLKEKLIEVLEKIASGASQEEAIFNFAKDIKHPDIDLFRVAFILSKREGSGLYKPLTRLTKVTRQRQSFRRKTQGAVAMQKMSAYGILASGFFIALIQFVMNRKNFIIAFHDPLGIKIMLVGGVFLLAGIAWMIYLTREKL